MKRSVYTMLALLLVVLTVVGCSQVPKAQTAEEEVPSGGPVTLRLLSLYNDAGLDQVISAFYATHPNVRVERVPVGVNDRSSADFVVSKVSDGSVDIVQMTDGRLVIDRLLLPLDAYIQKTQFDLKPYGNLIEARRSEGKLYELPTSLSPQVLLYNQDLVEKAGVKLPAGGITWEELRSAAARLTGDGVWGFTSNYPEGLVSLYATQKTGGPLSWSQKPNSQDVTEALQFFSAMVFGDKSMPATEKRDWTTVGPIITSSGGDPFMSGRAAITLASLDAWKYQYRDAKLKVELTKVPTVGGAKGKQEAAAMTYGIAGNTRYPDAAWQFLTFLAGPEGQAILAGQGAFPAYHTPATRQAWFDQSPKPPEATGALFDTEWLVSPVYPQQGKDQPPRAVLRARFLNIPANAVLSGQKPVADAVADWERAWQQK